MSSRIQKQECAVYLLGSKIAVILEEAIYRTMQLYKQQYTYRQRYRKVFPMPASLQIKKQAVLGSAQIALTTILKIACQLAFRLQCVLQKTLSYLRALYCSLAIRSRLLATKPQLYQGNSRLKSISPLFSSVSIPYIRNRLQLKYTQGLVETVRAAAGCRRLLHRSSQKVVYTITRSKRGLFSSADIKKY